MLKHKIIKQEQEWQETYSPTTSDASNDTTRDHHRLEAPRTLENHSTQRTRHDAVSSIVLTPRVAQTGVKPVVDHRDHTSRVTKERSTPRNGVESTVEADLRRSGDGRLLQSLRQTPGTTESQTSKVGRSRSIAEVVGPTAGGQYRARSGCLVERGVFERDVVEGILVQAGEGMELGRVGKIGQEAGSIWC